MMTSKKLFALLEELSPSGFSEELMLMWLSNCQNSILTDVLLLSHEECKEYTQVTDAPLFVPHPFDKLYLPYMQAQMHHAYGETDKYRNYMALYNAYRDEYAVHLLSRFEPAYGEAIKMGYYLTAYGLARAHGYQGSEEEWLKSLVPRFTIGTVETIATGEQATATISGTAEAPILNLRLPMGQRGPEGGTELPVAMAISAYGIDYTAQGENLPNVAAGAMIGKQIIFVPDKDAANSDVTLALNGGKMLPIRARSLNTGAVVAVNTGDLLAGVPYTLTFDGECWIADIVQMGTKLRRFLGALGKQEMSVPLFNQAFDEDFSFLKVEHLEGEDGKESVSVYSKGATEELVKLGAIDVTQAYEAAVTEGTVKNVNEFLWTLPAGRYYLHERGKSWGVRYYLHAMAGEVDGDAVVARQLYDVSDYCFARLYCGNCAHDAVPDLEFEGDTGELLVRGQSLKGKDGVDGKDGKDGADGKDGTDGADGADGYTPVRGKDYFTPEDVAQIVAQASAEAKAAAVEEALSVMRAPTLLPQDTWYQGNTARTAITEIRVMDSYTPPETDAVVECWNADTTDQTVVGRIRCYIVNDTELIIAGDGSGRIMANPDSKLLFAGANASKVYTAVERISGLEYIDTRNVTTLQAVFNQMTSLRTLSGYENWDVSRCTKFRLAFNADSKLEKLDLSKWEVSKAVDDAGKEGNVNVLDGSVMGKMLHNCHALRELKLNKSFDLRFAHLPVPRDYEGTSVTKEYRWLDTDTLLTYEDKDDDATVTAAGTVLFAFGDRADGTVGGDGLINPALVGRNVTLVADLYEKEVENV